MNDFPQDELLSAYLDGELTDAEREEAERLLADDPAARRLLEELRALSAALKSLPREKPAVDFSSRVLHDIERRALSAESPTPLKSTLAKRFLNRRAIGWAALATAIAVMISVNEYWQRSQFIANAPKQVARKAARSEKFKALEERKDVAAESSISAPGGDVDKKPADGASGIRAVDAFDKEGYAGKMEKERLEVAKPAAAPMPAKSPAAPLSAKALGEPVPVNAPAAITKGAEDDKKLDVVRGKKGGGPVYGKAAAGKAAADADAASNVLVIRCNISQEAVKRQSFDRLLLSNGIVSPQRRNQMQQAAQFAKKDEIGKTQKQSGEKAVSQSEPAVAEDEEVVDVEATPAQLEATLAGLESQPDLFPFVSVDATVEEQRLAGSQLNRNANIAPNSAGEQQQQRQANAPPQQQPGLQNAQEKPNLAMQSDSFANAASNRVRLQNQMQMQQLIRPSQQQRAMFVIRVVDVGRPAAAAKAEQAESNVNSVKTPLDSQKIKQGK